MHQSPPPVYDVFSAQCPALRKPYAFGSKRMSSLKNPHPMPCPACLHLGLYRVTVPCHHLLFRCLSCTQAWGGLGATCPSGVKLRTSLCRPYLVLAKTWCHKRALLPSPHPGLGADVLGPLQDRGLLSARTQKAYPKCAAGHAPGVGNSCEALVPCETDTASERDPHGEGRGLQPEASLHRANPQCVR